MILGPLKSKGGDAPGLYEEAAFLHKASKTLLTTDLIQAVPSEIPDVIADDLRPLVFHARDNVLSVCEDTPANRRIGWERIVLFSLFFQVPIHLCILCSFIHIFACLLVCLHHWFESFSSAQSEKVGSRHRAKAPHPTP